VELFNQIDMERDRWREQIWRAQGGTGEYTRVRVHDPGQPVC